jgi:hypothetical protein
VGYGGGSLSQPQDPAFRHSGIRPLALFPSLPPVSALFLTACRLSPRSCLPCFRLRLRGSLSALATGPGRSPHDDGLCLYTPVTPSLALFCGFTVRPIQIGFVSHISLPGPGHSPHDDGLCPYTPVPPSLALFCGFTVRPGQIGFVSHISLPGPGHSQHDDGLCLYTPVLPSLALFCGFTVRPGQIGFVLHISLPMTGHSPHDDGLYPYTSVPPSLALFCGFTVRPGRIGFVWRIWPPASAPGRPLSIRNPQSPIRDPGPPRPLWLDT